MTEPTRWAEDDAELNEDERRVLAAGLRPAEVPKDMENAIWGALGAKLPLVAASTTVGASATKAAATLSLVKVGLTGVLLGSVATGAWVGGERLLSFSARHGSPARSAVAPAQTTPRGERTATSVAPTPVSPTPALVPVPELPTRGVSREPPNANHELPSAPPREEPTPSARNGVAPERSVASFPLPAPATTSVAGTALVESRRVAEARSRLRAGDARGALATLESVRRDFPGGVLAQERDALTIEALLALGDRVRARELATSFLARYPDSPHRAGAERALR